MQSRAVRAAVESAPGAEAAVRGLFPAEELPEEGH